MQWAKSGEGRGLVLPPADVILDEYNVYGPDLVWIAERHRQRDLHRRLERVPELCVEIRSPSTWRYDVGAKKSARGDTLTSPQPTGFELALDDLFRD